MIAIPTEAPVAQDAPFTQAQTVVLRALEEKWNVAARAWINETGPKPHRLRLCRVGASCPSCSGGLVVFKKSHKKPTADCKGLRIPSEGAQILRKAMHRAFPEFVDVIAF